MVLLQLQSGPPLDEMSIACILRDLLHAIDYLHTEGKIHRDIKGISSDSFLFLYRTLNLLFLFHICKFYNLGLHFFISSIIQRI